MNRRARRTAAFALVVCVVASLTRDVAGQGSYVSPFSIGLEPGIAAWTSDFSARRTAIEAHTSPARADWYTAGTIYSGSSLPYGPLNPQLYSSATIGSPDTATALQSDRGAPVYGVSINAAPGGVDPDLWRRQRILAAADSLLRAGTPYQHLHLPTFDPAQVTSGTGFPWNSVSTDATLQSSWQLSHGQSGTTPNPYAADYGRPTTGIDCTDFTAYVYNLGLGIQMHSGTPNQIEFIGETKPTVGGTATATVVLLRTQLRRGIAQRRRVARSARVAVPSRRPALHGRPHAGNPARGDVARSDRHRHVGQHLSAGDLQPRQHAGDLRYPSPGCHRLPERRRHSRAPAAPGRPHPALRLVQLVLSRLPGGDAGDRRA